MKRLFPLVLAAALAWPVPASAQEPSPSPSPRGPYVPQVVPVEDPPVVELPPPTGDVPEESLRPLTADEAARIALAWHSDVRRARAGVEAAEGRLKTSRAGLHPQFRVTASYSDNFLDGGVTGVGTGSGVGTNVGTGGANLNASGGTVNTSATLSQLLFDFGHTRSQVQQSEALRRSAGANLSRVQADLVLQVKQAFYQHVQAMQLVEVAEKNVANQREHLAQARGRFDTGIGLPADVTRAQTAVSQAVFELTRARADAQVSRVNLALLMGIDPRTPVAVADSSEPVLDVTKPQVLFDLAVQLRPELDQVAAEIEAGEHSVRAARTGDDPVVSAGLGYNRSSASSFAFDSLMLTVGVQWQAYDGGAADGRVQEALANLDSSKAQYEGTRERVQAEVARAWLNLQAAQQALVTARAAEVNARETLRLATGRYRVGLGIFLDVLDAQQALVRAEVEHVNAETALDLTRAGLNYAVGQPLADQVGQAGGGGQ